MRRIFLITPGLCGLLNISRSVHTGKLQDIILKYRYVKEGLSLCLVLSFFINFRFSLPPFKSVLVLEISLVCSDLVLILVKQRHHVQFIYFL